MKKFLRGFCSNALLTGGDVTNASALGLIEGPGDTPMSQNEQDALIAEFRRKKGTVRNFVRGWAVQLTTP
jgi:hypothetical protein